MPADPQLLAAVPCVLLAAYAVARRAWGLFATADRAAGGCGGGGCGGCPAAGGGAVVSLELPTRRG